MSALGILLQAHSLRAHEIEPKVIKIEDDRLHLMHGAKSRHAYSVARSG